MKRLLFTAIFFSFSYLAFSWGATGHRITGKVADRYLSKKARAAVARILNSQSLAMASTWMDEVRSDSTYDYMSDWHWVTIPDGMTYEQCEKNPKGDIIATLERVIQELKSHKLSAKDEAERLKILIHLIGDIHQPLHVGRPDRGGNDIKVSWFRTDTNLHHVWDTDIIEDTNLSYTEFAESLENPSKEKLAQIQKSTVRSWAAESVGCRAQIYKIGNGKLSYEYSYFNMPLVRERLLLAGVRLAGVLNEIYR
jgi:hypothetical protein